MRTLENSGEAHVVIEYNGVDYINLVLDKNGGTKIFKDEYDANKWAKKNIAFNYKIVRIY